MKKAHVLAWLLVAAVFFASCGAGEGTLQTADPAASISPPEGILPEATTEEPAATPESTSLTDAPTQTRPAIELPIVTFPTTEGTAENTAPAAR